MMDMSVRVETWPIAADDVGLWLISGLDAWRPDLPVASGSEPHAEVELTCARHGLAAADIAALHSTSWRINGDHVILTFVAAVRSQGLVAERWPDASPIGPDLADAVGPPTPHGAAAPPAPRYVDVLFHALRHLRFLLDTDGEVAGVLDANWRRHLGGLTPFLATMHRGVVEADTCAA